MWEDKFTRTLSCCTYSFISQLPLTSLTEPESKSQQVIDTQQHSTVCVWLQRVCESECESPVSLDLLHRSLYKGLEGEEVVEGSGKMRRRH